MPLKCFLLVCISTHEPLVKFSSPLPSYGRGRQVSDFQHQTMTVLSGKVVYLFIFTLLLFLVLVEEILCKDKLQYVTEILPILWKVCLILTQLPLGWAWSNFPTSWAAVCTFSAQVVSLAHSLVVSQSTIHQ